MTASSDRYQSTRRQFLAAASAASVGLVSRSALGESEPSVPVTLTPSPEQDLMRVRIEMEMKGNVNVPSDPLVSRKSELTLPTNSKAVFDYEERYRRPAGADSSSEITAIERYYHEATSKGRLNKSESNYELRDSVRQTQVRRDRLPETIYSVDDYFTQDEISLLKVPVASSAVDQILPLEPVSVGDNYRPSEGALASLLNLSSVEASTVAVDVVEVNADDVKFQFKGKVEGSVDGVPTSIQTVGKLTFDRTINTCTWLVIAVHETREIGKAEPGFDVAATIRMVRQPLPKTVALPKQPAAMAIVESVPQDRLYVEQQSQGVNVAAMMDRRWRMMSDMNGNSMLRMIENEQSIAQCNLRSLARLQPGKQWTLEAFQADVKQTLGNELNDLLQADQRVSATGLRVLRVVAQGSVEGVPIQWIMLHFSDDSGRRVLATFTMDSKMVDAFMASDAQFADSLRLLGSANAEEVAETGVADAEVANASNQVKSDNPPRAEVQSPSDFQ